MHLTVLRFSLTAFLGSFLSFAMQPMAGKALLPPFGGSFMVWAVTLCFFQLALLAGYGIAHLLFAVRVSRARAFGWAMFLGLSAWLLPPSLNALRQSGPLFQTMGFDILARLVTGFGLPAVGLFAGSIMLQRFWRSTPGSTGQDPTIFYAASNLGSLGALLGYLFLIEPNFPLGTQEAAFRWLYPIWLFFFVTCIPLQPSEELSPEQFVFPLPISGKDLPERATGTQAESALTPNSAANGPDSPTPSPAEDSIDGEPAPAGLFLQAAAGSAVLTSTTTLLTLDVSPMPFLWVAPLTLYLLTFILVFRDAESVHHTVARRFTPALALGFSLALIHQLTFNLGALPRLILHLITLYYLCLGCHSRFLAAGPPAPHRLTRFYLFIAAGGAAGSFSVTFLAPLLFGRLQEFSLSLFLAAWACRRHLDLLHTTRPRGGLSPLPDAEPASPDPFFPLRALALVLLFLVFPAFVNQGLPVTESFLPPVTAGAIVYGWLALRAAEKFGGREVASAAIMALCLMLLPVIGATGTERLSLRTWYGLYRVFDQGEIRYLQMGSTYHGSTWLDPEKAHRPLLYYHPDTAIGRFFSQPDPLWKRAAVIGLGAGTLAAFSRSGQELVFLELDPAQEPIARDWFPYLKHASGTISIRTGDGRLLLRTETRPFDLIVFDAFSSDSIPAHLLTVEAAQEALGKLASGGILLFHISNRHLNLLPVLHANAGVLGLHLRVSRNRDSDDPDQIPTRWVAMGPATSLERFFAIHPDWQPLPERIRTCRPWTDDFANPWVPLLSYDLLDTFAPASATPSVLPPAAK